MDIQHITCPILLCIFILNRPSNTVYIYPMILSRIPAIQLNRLSQKTKQLFKTFIFWLKGKYIGLYSWVVTLGISNQLKYGKTLTGHVYFFFEKYSDALVTLLRPAAATVHLHKKNKGHRGKLQIILRHPVFSKLQYDQYFSFNRILKNKYTPHPGLPSMPFSLA